MEKKKYFIKKEKLLNILYLIVKKQNNYIKNKNYNKVILYENRKYKLLKKMKEIDEGIKSLNKDNIENNVDTIKNINVLFDELIKLEKENELLVSKEIMEHRGERISVYEHIKKLKK